MRQNPRRSLAVIALVAVCALAAAFPVGASGYTAAPPVRASGPSPFAGCTVGAGDATSVNYPNAEVEPFVAVNPRNPLNIIGVFQQDRWSDGGAHGLVAAVTHDGGQTWSERWAHFSTCAGGTAANGGAYDRASDPWVTFGPDGTAYQISLSVSADNLVSAILASRSTDGGETWSEPATLIRDTDALHFNDKESITADPTRPGYAYAVWDRGTLPGDPRSANSELHSAAYRGQPMFSRTTDGGRTWSAPRAMSNQNIFTIGNQIAVLPDGTLVDVFADYRGSGRQPSANQAFEAVMLSKDAGLTWSQPIKIANQAALPVLDPEPNAQREVRAGTDIPDIAVDRTSGALYVVWADGGFSGGAHNDIALSRSTDGGRSWSVPIKVNRTPTAIPAGNQQAFTPAVEVAADGTVGVSYYDFRNNTPDAATLLTDAWLAHSHDGGQTLSEAHVGGPFDMRTAPYARGFFIGDYQGLASVGATFVPFFAMANTGDLTNRTDIFATQVGP